MKQKTKDNIFIGFIYYLISTIILAFQFFFFLISNMQSVYMDFGGWVFYVVSCLSHAAIVVLIPFIIFYLLPTSLKLKRNIALNLMLVVVLCINVFVVIDKFVFSLYRFHLNGLVMSMFFGVGSKDIFVFDWRLYLKAILILLVFIGLNVGGIFLSIKLNKLLKNKKRFNIIAIVSILSLTVLANGIHVYGYAMQKSSIVKSSTFIPYYYPLTANSLLDKMGIYSKEKFNQGVFDKEYSTVNYPKNKIEYGVSEKDKKPNVIIIAIDSWNRRTLTQETMPNTYKFANSCEWYTNHFSSSNGTRGSIFGLFYGISSIYWKDFDLAQKQPLLIHSFVKYGYHCQTYPSATLLSPPFAKIIFKEIKNLNVGGVGKNTYEADCLQTNKFITDLKHYDGNKPMFAFLFYDLAHAISLPKNKITHFSPSWKYADYTALNNNMDPTPYFNLYRNCVYQVDSLVGKVISAIKDKGIMDNTIIIITGDHAQEFNENHKNYWGHNGNFSKEQICVPLLYYYPNCQPKKMNYRTTHYDVPTTLLRQVFKLKNPTSDYSMGKDLHDVSSRCWHLVGSDIDYAFIVDKDIIITKKPNGTMEIYDAKMNPINYSPNAKTLSNAIKKMNSFYK
jgi:membrane-anchored protein YejM (alkaline phosphatase superfamily)